jgi:hypothetical protein
LRNQLEFREWAAGRLKNRKLPARLGNIPANPDNVYSDLWQGFNDFLGTPKPRTVGRVWRSFQQAREYVRSLKLTSYLEYKEWSNGKLKNKPGFPDDIPAHPYGVYGKGKDWKGISDFLGSKPSGKYVQMRPFAEARNLVRKLKLGSSTEYVKWAGGGVKGVPPRPPDIPVVPHAKYRSQWRGWADWLGLSSSSAGDERQR